MTRIEPKLVLKSNVPKNGPIVDLNRQLDVLFFALCIKLEALLMIFMALGTSEHRYGDKHKR